MSITTYYSTMDKSGLYFSVRSSGLYAYFNQQPSWFHTVTPWKSPNLEKQWTVRILDDKSKIYF